VRALQVDLFEAFIVSAEELNYRRAAERLALSQPGLSQQIRRLEHQLGTHLFSRNRRGTRLTRRGEELLPLARILVQVVGQISEVANRRPVQTPQIRLRLRVGVLGDGLGSLTWPLLAAFSRVRPDVDILLIPMGFLEAFNAIDCGRADVVLATGPLTPSEGKEVVSVGQEAIAALFTARHPLAAENTAELERVARGLTFDTPPGSDPAFRRFWLQEDLRAQAPRQTSRLRPPPDGPVLDDLVRHVGHVGGMGLWPESIPVAPESGCVMRPLDQPLFAPRQVAARRDEDHARTFLRIARELTPTTDSPDP